MDAGRPKRKRSELELLLGKVDLGSLSAFSPRLPALSVSSPVLAEATAESDEQLARRLHEELNGMRMTRRGSKAVTEDPASLSPPARGIPSPHGYKSKAETPKAHGGQGRSSLPLLPPITKSPPGAADGGAGVAAEDRTLETESGVPGVLGAAQGGATGTGPAAAGPGSGAGADAGSGTGFGSASVLVPPPEGGGEAVKRKRNSVPARELHLLLQQASSAAGRAEATLSPTRSARSGLLASARTEPAAMGNDSHHHSTSHQQGNIPLPPRRDSDRSNSQQGGQQHQHQPAGSTASAPVAPPSSPSVTAAPSLRGPQPPPPPSPRASLLPPPSLLPPKLKQRYLSGSSPITRIPASASASENYSGRRLEGNTTTGSGGATTVTATTATTAATPSCVLGGARDSLLSGQSVEGSSVQSQPQLHARDGSSAGAAYTLVEAGASAAASAASLVTAGPRTLAGTGASIGGCSSTDETENDNDNSCPAAVAGVGDGGPSATSPKAAPALQLPPPLPPTGPGGTSQQQHTTEAAGHTTEPGVEDDEPHGRAQWAAGTAAQPLPNEAKQGQAQGHLATGPLKVPKLPMIRAGRGWYRGRLMRESVDGHRVLLDVPGALNPVSSSSSNGHPQNQPFWLPVTSDRIWRGSYKGKDWKYLGDGAWEPKPAAFKRGKQGSSSNGLPLPLPQWAVDTTSGGAEAEAQALPVNAAAYASGVGTTATGVRSNADRGCWSSPDETSDDGEAAEEPQQVAPEGPNTRSGQRPKRRSPPTVATFGFGKAAPTATTAQVAVVAAGDLKRKGPALLGLDSPADAVAADATAGAIPEGEVAPAARRTEAKQHANAGASCQDEAVKTAADGASDGAALVTESGAFARPACVAETAVVPGKEGQAVPQAEDAVVPMEGACASIDRGPSAAVVAAAATSPRKPLIKAQREEVGGDGGEGCGSVPVTGQEEGGEDGGDIGWTPGVTHPRKHVPRRAQRRRQRIRTPFDGLQLNVSHHQPQHNPYAFFPVLSDESGRDGDASDAELGGGRRGSGDGTVTAPQHGSRRRAAARAAAVAAAAARAEAEAEEEELEEILLGRRPPRRDRFHPQHGSGGVPGRRNPHNQYHHRSRSGPRADSYLYGDSSGNPDDPYSVDGAVYVHGSSIRPRASSRGNPQPAPEYMSVASESWEALPWQTAGLNQMGDGGTGQLPSAPQAPPRNRRKGKPSRSRMDGEGDGWCCGEDDWELEARGGAWARMPEVLRRLYYMPCPAVAVANADGGDTGNSDDAGANLQQQQQQRQQQQKLRQQQELVEAGLALTYRQSGGGAYFGALQFSNKRRRAYEDDPAVSLDDLDLDLEAEVDDHEHDADYLPPYGTAGGSRRSSSFGGGGGRRCSANGGSGGAVKRQRAGDALYLNDHPSHYQQCHQNGHDSEAAMVVLAHPKRRILVTCGLPPGRSSGTLGSAGGVTAEGVPGSGTVDGGIPAGLAGLLEAALGQDTASAAAVVHVANGNDPTGWVPAVKVELEPTGLDTAPAAGGVVDRLAGGGAHAAGATGALPPLEAGSLPALAPGDPHGAHVALSDSSAAPSGLEDSKYSGGGGGSAAATAIDASGLVTCVDGSTGDAALLLQQQQPQRGSGTNNSSGGGAGYIAGGSSPSPPGVQFDRLRSNTPTRAKRTGRPPFVGLGAGAPMPKLPALSSTASHRMQMVVMAEAAGLATIAADAATPIDGLAANGGGGAAAAAAEAPEDSHHQPSTEVLDGRGSEEAQVPTRPAVDVTMERPMGVKSILPADSELVEEAHKTGCGRGGLAGACKLWQTAGGGNGGGGAAAKAMQARAVARDVGGGGATCQRDGPVLISNTHIGAASMPATKPYGGGEVTGYCVMDAIGALKFDKQPAMQQLAVRAQLEVEMCAAQHHHHHGVAARTQDEQLLQVPQHLAQQQQRLLQGRGSSGRSGGSGVARSGSLSAAASPTASDPLISSLPSVEVVVNLYSARTPHGSAQQALTELVGGSTALPLFQ